MSSPRIKSNKLPKRETTPTAGRNATNFSWVSVPIYLINIAFQVFARFTVSDRHTRVPLNDDTDTKAILCLKFPLDNRVLKDFSSPKNSFLKSLVVAYHEILQRAFRELVRASTPAKCISVFVQKSRLQLALCFGNFQISSLTPIEEIFKAVSTFHEARANANAPLQSKSPSRSFSCTSERHKIAFVAISAFPALLVARTFKNLL